MALAVAVEIVGNSLVINRLEDTLLYDLNVVLEEGLEMIGVILFIHTLLDYLRQPDGHVYLAAAD